MKKPKTKKNRETEPELEPEEDFSVSSVCDFTGLIPSAVKDDIEEEAYEDLYPQGFHD